MELLYLFQASIITENKIQKKVIWLKGPVINNLRHLFVSNQNQDQNLLNTMRNIFPSLKQPKKYNIKAILKEVNI